MKTIGLIGGMSWESSLEYYRIINETTKERHDDHSREACCGSGVEGIRVFSTDGNDRRQMTNRPGRRREPFEAPLNREIHPRCAQK
jgi:aspartate/glutamate racemase